MPIHNHYLCTNNRFLLSTVRSLLEDVSIILSVFTVFCFSPLLSSPLFPSILYSFFLLYSVHSILHTYFPLYSSHSLFYFTYVLSFLFFSFSILFYIRTFLFILLLLYSILHTYFPLYSTPSLFYFTYIHLNPLKICFFFYCFFRWKVFLKGII